MFALRSTCFRFLQHAKAPSPICFSDAGAMKDLSPDLRNAHFPRISNPSLGRTDYNVILLSNARDWTSVTVRGNVYVLAQPSETIVTMSLFMLV